MATFQTLFSNPITPSRDDDFGQRLKAAGSTAELLDATKAAGITIIAVGVWADTFHHLNFPQYQAHYAFTPRIQDPTGQIAWQIGQRTKWTGPGSQVGTINLLAGKFLKGIFVLVDDEWKRETPA